MPACPVGPADRTGVVKIFAFLELERNLTFFKGLMINALVPNPGYFFGVMRILISTHLAE